MRPVREITSEMENFRIEPHPDYPSGVVRRDPVEPEPVGTLVLMPFRIRGYRHTPDGSLVAQLVGVDSEYRGTDCIADYARLSPGTALVVTPEELWAMFRGKSHP